MGRQNFTITEGDISTSNIKVKPSWTPKQKIEYKEKIMSFLRENYKTLKVPISRKLPPSTSWGYIESRNDNEMSKLIHFLFLTDEDILNAIEIIEDLKKRISKEIIYKYEDIFVNYDMSR